MGFKNLFLFFSFVVILLVGFVSTKCNPKDFGNGSPVCVCSSRQSCDGELKGFSVSADKSVVTGVRSSKAGDRFVHQDYKFSKQETAGVLKITIDNSKKYQKILGFGGAFTDSAGHNIGKLPKPVQERLMKDYFSADDGIGYRVCRVPIGGSDFSPRAYSLDDHEGDDKLEKFALQQEDFNYKLPYIKEAQTLTHGALKMFGSAWSSPKWMKTNKEFNHGGFLIGHPGEKYYKMYAEYLVKFLQAYKKEGVNVWGITVANEPGAGFDPHYGINCLGFNATMQRDFVKLDLGPALHSAGFANVKVMILDDNVGKMKEFAQTILGDAAARKYVSGVAFHWYANGGSGQIAPLDYIAQNFPEVFTLNTEACDLQAAKLGNWVNFDRYATDIMNDLNHHAAGWVEWNMVLDYTSPTGWDKSHMDANIIIDGKTGEYYKQPTYYALGHFSRFVLPDSVRIGFDVQHGDNNVMASAFERPDGVKVAVALNKNARAIKVELHDPASGFITAELPANSMETFLWH